MQINPRYTSIIVTNHIPNDARRVFAQQSFESLLKTTKDYPVEIIVVDNGGENIEISDYLFTLAVGGFITYIRNPQNMHFGFARNQGLAMAHGNYIVIADNDILYKDGWLEACWKPLELYPARKIYTTSIEYPTGFLKERYDQGKLDVDGVEYNLNMRAGSNCFMIRRKDFFQISPKGFLYHRVAGTVWTDIAVRAGFLAAVSPDKLTQDLALRLGYDHRKAVPIKKVLRNGEEVFLNEDEYRSL